MVKNPLSNAGDMGLIPDWVSEIHLSPCTTTTEKTACPNKEPTCGNGRSQMPKLRPKAAKNKYINVVRSIFMNEAWKWKIYFYPILLPIINHMSTLTSRRGFSGG